ncbi:surfeit locus protein 6 homolog [Phlebotomus argentipes]|uniref:surfeit locus protein 6 homolog n=1 Tax=Phlebotomus argentipes TaxID=94469 RepID=UPI0028930C6C|nr:surfeit locus protein 6 homolog [Phlebotomus argentipes]
MMMKRKQLKQLLVAENAFVSDLLLLCDVPDPENEDDDVLEDTGGSRSAKRMKLMLKKTPAELKAAADARASRTESAMKNRKTKNPNQKRDRKLKNKNKKSKIPQAISVKVAVKKEAIIKQENANEKPKFNQGEKIIFNRVEFDQTKKSKGGIRNPEKALEKLNETKAKIRHMMESGETDKALTAKSDLAWRKAFDRNEGKKVKDNKFALKKSMDRKEAQKKKSAKMWQERKKKVQENIEARAKKVEENKKKKSQDKLKKKVKRLQKKGKIVNV